MTEEQLALAHRLFPGDSYRWLEEAVAETHGTHELVDVIDGLVAGKLILWRGERSIGIGEFLNFPRLRVFNMFLAGGDLNEFKACRAGVEAYARGGGAGAVQFCGRITEAARGRIGTLLSGWIRAFPGYTPRWICFMKELP